MRHRFSRRQFAGGAIALTVASTAPAAARANIERLLGDPLRQALQPLMGDGPFDIAALIEAIRGLEREAGRLKLPASELVPRSLSALSLDPERFYELALPRLVALVDRAESGNVPFADRAGELLARLHATQWVAPEAPAGAIARASVPPRRAILLALAGPAAGGLLSQLPPIVLPPGDDDLPEPAAPLPVSRALRFAELREEYGAYFASATLRTEHRDSADFHLAMMRKSRARYTAVGQRAGVPWAFIAAIHGLEASFNFRAHLHNGDFPLNQRTRQVPADRPGVWLPPSDWESSALDALRVLNFVGQDDWSVPRMLHRLEAYNGFGYRRRGVVSPYLWSFSNHYERGKFVADGRWDPRARSQQCGAATMIRLLVDAGEIEG